MWNSPQIIKCALVIHLSVADHKIKLFGVGVLAMAQKCHVVNVCGPVYMMFNAQAAYQSHMLNGSFLFKQDKCEIELI